MFLGLVTRLDAFLELLGENEAFVLRNHHRAFHLVARCGQVALRRSSRLLVLLDCEKDAREAALIAAFAQKRDRRLQLELTGLRGDALVRFAENVLYPKRFGLRCASAGKCVPAPHSFFNERKT